MGDDLCRRCVGVIADGPTDRAILGCLTQRFLGESTVLELRRQSIRDHVDRFWSKASRSGETAFASEAANTFAKGVVNVLFGAYGDLCDMLPRLPTSDDLIILSSDAERVLDHRDRYFDDWAWILAKIAVRGIEMFHHAMTAQGYELVNLPAVVPFLPFPSTDVMIAAARGHKSSIGAYRGVSANQLKQQLYGTRNLTSLSANEFADLALSHLSSQGLQTVYHEIPESRPLLHALAAR